MAVEPELPDVFDPDNSSTAEPPVFEEGPHHVLTPMGQVESYGRFARSLGPRRVKMLFVGTVAAIVALLIAASL